MKTQTHEIITKAFPAFITKTSETQGIVEAIVAVTGNLDYGDDVIVSGAFKKTITERGTDFQVLDNHNTWSAEDAIAKVLEIKEVGRSELPQALRDKYPDATGGLSVIIQFLIDDPTDKSYKIFKRIKAGIITRYSFAYEIVLSEFRDVETDNGKRRVHYLKELRLWEVSPVIFAMNPATQTVGAKSKSDVIENDNNENDGEFFVSHDKSNPDNYRMADDNQQCKTCRHFVQVTLNRGYCKQYDTVTTANYVSDGYEGKNPTVRELVMERILAFLQAMIEEFASMGAWDESSVDIISEMVNTLAESLIDMLPAALLENELSVLHVPKSHQPKTEAEPQPALDDEPQPALDDEPQPALTDESVNEKFDDEAVKTKLEGILSEIERRKNHA